MAERETHKRWRDLSNNETNIGNTNDNKDRLVERTTLIEKNIISEL